MMKVLLEAGFEWIARLVVGARWRVWLAGLCLAAAVVLQMPKVTHAYAQLFTHTERLDYNLAFIQEQAAHPFTPRDYPSKTHLAKMAFRLAVPLLMHTLHLSLWHMLVLQVVLGFWVFYYAARLLEVSLGDRVAAALLTLGLSRTYFGYTFSYDLFGYFDGFGYAALLFMVGARRWAVVFGLCLAAAFVDERVLVASPLLVFWYGARQYDWQWPGGLRWLVTRPATAVYAAWVTYGVVRLGLAWHYQLAIKGGLVGISALGFSAWRELVAAGLAESLKSYWLLVVLAVALLLYQQRYLVLGVLLVCYAPIFLGAFLVTDITRSLAFGMPVVFICLDFLGRFTTPTERRYLAATTVFFALLMPSYFTTGWLQYAGPVWMVALRAFTKTLQ